MKGHAKEPTDLENTKSKVQSVFICVHLCPICIFVDQAWLEKRKHPS